MGINLLNDCGYSRKQHWQSAPEKGHPNSPTSLLQAQGILLYLFSGFLCNWFGCIDWGEGSRFSVNWIFGHVKKVIFLSIFVDCLCIVLSELIYKRLSLLDVCVVSVCVIPYVWNELILCVTLIFDLFSFSGEFPFLIWLCIFVCMLLFVYICNCQNPLFRKCMEFWMQTDYIDYWRLSMNYRRPLVISIVIFQLSVQVLVI